MNEQFQERRNIYLGLAGLILLLLIVLFFAVLKPMIDDKSTKEATALQLQEQNEKLEVEKKRAENKDDTVLDDKIYYKTKMPLNPDLDELMRSLETVEAVSMSRIDKIEFGYDGELPLPEPKEEEADTKVDVDVNVDSDSAKPGEDAPDAKADVEVETKEDTNEAETTQPVPDLTEQLQVPDNLRMISMRMEVASPDYEHFNTLMKEIEKIDRVTLVNTMEFKKPAEAELILDENPDESVTCTVELVTFYYDGPVEK